MTYDVWDNKFSQDIYLQKYSLNGVECWGDTCKRVIDNVCGQHLDSSTKEKIYKLMYDRKFIPGGRYLAASGKPYHMINNCFAFRAEDSREGWGDLANKAIVTLSSGGGIGVDYSLLREEGARINKTGGKSSGPLALMHIINELARNIMSAGERRSAVLGSLCWSHPDVKKFMAMKNHSDELKAMKLKDHNFALPMELTNISVIYDTEFFVAMENVNHPKHALAKEIWKQNCKQAFSTAEPGMLFNFLKDKDSLRNACGEYITDDDSDRCNLGTLWINRFKDKKEFEQAVKYSTLFLMCGGIYSMVPFSKVKEVGDKNNNIGLGLGGIHEWLMQNNHQYECVPELHKWLRIYEQESDASAYIGAKQLGVSIPKRKRAIAPNGTIGMLAETTTGIEPLFCKAYKRRYFKDGNWVHQYVVDGAVKRLMSKGIKPELIQDAYSISFKDRVKFQADVQNYVDMGISSTCNMAPWGSEINNDSTVESYSDTLLVYAKRLRGFTAYPDGCRSGQPLTTCEIKEALEKEGTVYEEKVRECTNGVCGL